MLLGSGHVFSQKEKLPFFNKAKGIHQGFSKKHAISDSDAQFWYL